MPESNGNRIALFVSASIVIALILFAMLRDRADALTLQKATQLLNEKKVTKVIVSKKYVYLQTKNKLYKIASSQVRPKMFVHYKVEVKETSVLVYILFFILFLAVLSLLYPLLKKIYKPHDEQHNTLQTQQGNFQAELNAPVEAIKSDVSFEDIGGIDDVKVELEEIIDFMRHPKRYKNFGARLPRGVLLVGPPGVGKTMIAKAVANAADVPFYYQSGASFVQIYVGMGAKRVHELFAAAKKNAPSIIFIDEIDAVGKKRDGNRNDEREATLNQLLTEMDGFEASSSVIVVAATNKIDVLDSALLRAGRFDRRIFVELPTIKERESILLKYLSKIPSQVDTAKIASMTVGFNGAALAALVNEAALLALRENDLHVRFEHFEQVKDKVMFGKKKLQMLNERQKSFRITYQAGKVLVATYFDLPFEKLMLTNEKLTPTTNEPFVKGELEARVQMLLAGMVACDIRYNEHANSVQYDLEEAKEIVKKMCYDYGMGTQLLADETEAAKTLTRLYETCYQQINSLMDVMDEIEKILLEKESITKAEVQRCLNAVS